MTFEEIDERYHDAALDDDGDSWDEEAVEREAGWDDPGEPADESGADDPDTEEQ